VTLMVSTPHRTPFGIHALSGVARLPGLQRY
jgi:hypothetical protein